MSETVNDDPDVIPCHGCGRPTHLNLLDGKDDGTGDFNILACRDCYGPGWRPMRRADMAPHAPAMVATRRARQTVGFAAKEA
jgi:hypothetical protein